MVTEQLPKNCRLYLLLSWPAYSGHLYITDAVTPLTSWIHNFIVILPVYNGHEIALRLTDKGKLYSSAR